MYCHARAMQYDLTLVHCKSLCVCVLLQGHVCVLVYGHVDLTLAALPRSGGLSSTTWAREWRRRRVTLLLRWRSRPRPRQHP